MKKLSDKRVLFGKILNRISKYLPLLILSLLLAAASVTLSLLIPKYAGDVIDLIIGKGDVDMDGIIKLLCRIAVCAVGSAVFQYLMSLLNNRVSFCVVRDIRDEAFEKLLRLPLSYIDSHKTGDTVSRVIADAERFSDGLLLGFSQLFTGVVTIGATLVLMLTVNPLIAALAIILTPLSLFVSRFIASGTYKAFAEQSRTRGEQTAYIEEAVTGRRTVKAMNAEKQTEERFDGINDRLSKISLKAIFFSSLTNPTTRFVNGVVYAAVALTGALTVISGGGASLTVGGLSCLLSYAGQYAKPFNGISGVIAEFQDALAGVKRLFELIEQPPEKPDVPGARVLSDVDGNIELKDVYFSYVKNKPLIRNLNLSVQPGQKIAIVGPTGCGKTTLINLLMRFYDVDSGEISVQGTDIRDCTRESVRGCYGMVLQDTWLRRGCVRDNIAIGRPGASEEDIIAAAVSAHADSFIRRLPEGYDTLIGEGGGSLSQGQKQLLCIARVMLCRSEMLILDEATSSVDTRTELKIQDAFDRLMANRTSFIVAHRLSTIRSADVILVMKDGNVIEKGRHEELLSRGGFYSGLYNSQFEV